jgi:hypothetical protein
MAFNWNNFLVLAEALATRPDESSKRSAISRAYYSVFNPAFARAEMTAGRFPGHEASHNWCWNKYLRTPDPACNRLGMTGQRMKRRRGKADYQFANYRRIDEELQWTLEEARQFPADLAALNLRHPRP